MAANTSLSREAGIVAGQSDIPVEHVEEIAQFLRGVLADVFTLFMKTKNYHWHMTGPHFRDFHLMLDDHAAQLIPMIDEVAERARKLGAPTLRSIGDISQYRSLTDNEEEELGAAEMLTDLRDDNQRFVQVLRAAHAVCARHDDSGTSSMLEMWIDEGEKRVWFLSMVIQGF